MLETSRLRLVPLCHQQVVLYKNDQKALARNLGLRYVKRQHDPRILKDLEEAIEFWLESTARHAEGFEWCTNWEIILKEERVAVGGIGFSGFPDTEGKTMVGYGIDMRHYNRGYATEALQALKQWAFEHPELKAIVADTPTSNLGSHKVLIKNNFHETGRTDDLIHWILNRSE